MIIILAIYRTSQLMSVILFTVGGVLSQCVCSRGVSAPEGGLLWGCLLWGVSALGVCLLWGMSAPGGRGCLLQGCLLRGGEGWVSTPGGVPVSAGVWSSGMAFWFGGLLVW